MKKLISLAMAMILAVCLVFTTSLQAIATDTKGEDGYTYKTFDFSDMTYAAGSSEYSISGTKLNVTFSGLWDEIQFKLPEVVDVSKCPSVSFSGNCTNGMTCFKLYNTDNEEVAAQYDFTSNGTCTFTTDSELTNKKVDHVGIMSKEDRKLSVTINDVKFKVDAKDPGEDSNISPTRNLLTTYGQAFENVGGAVTAAKLSNPSILKFIKKEHNSVTPGNEMKPDAIMSSSDTVTIDEAKKLGYYIPEGYTESVVPKLNFDTVDSMLKTAADNGLTFRAHNLVWHRQTPTRFFKEGFNENGAYVSKDVMNKRLEFYIRSVMDHVYSGEYGNIIYAWDVVNEYLNSNDSGKSDWLNIYGSINTKPEFVKEAFEVAYDELQKYGVQDKVSLFYNDYNTYENVDRIKQLVSFINSDKKVCSGVGMQSHLREEMQYPSIGKYKDALQSFINAGYEVQITELDVTTNNLTTQGKYFYDLMSAIMDVKKTSDNDDSVGKITALIFWGLTDEDSWRSELSPLLYKDYYNQKPAYEQVLKAYEDSGYVPTKHKNLLGDVNGDGVVDVVDFSLLRRYINAGGSESTIKVKEENCDLNGDNVINFFDLAALKALI